MNKMQSLAMLETLALALCVAPLFAQQSNSQSSSPSTPSSQSQQPGQQPGQAQPGQAEPGQPPAGQTPDAQSQSAGDTQTFSGTVAKSGDKYVLQDASGKTYDVDRQEELKKYDGKQVRIKGTLDPDGKTIHVK
jgi:uncharacterized protein YdeI (BOF family)